MALIKENLDYGILANYWKVININLDTISKTGFICIALYVIKDANKFLETKTLNVYVDMFDKYFSKDNIVNYDDIYAASYYCIKENLEYFEDAIDDEDEKTQQGDDINES